MIEYPNKETGFFRLPQPPHEKWRWVRATGNWPLLSTMKVLGALRATIIVIDEEHQIMLIEPEPGHENGVWEILGRISVKIEEDAAKKYLAKVA